MADIKTKYGTSNQAITITLASLGNSATVGRESTVVSNAVNLFLDALVNVIIETGVVASDKAAYIYAYGSVDGGVIAGGTFTERCTGADAAFTRRDPTSLKLLGVIPTPTNSVIYEGGPFSVAAAFGGVLPEFWGIVVMNFTGAALSADAGDNKAFYQGVYADVI